MSSSVGPSGVLTNLCIVKFHTVRNVLHPFGAIIVGKKQDDVNSLKIWKVFSSDCITVTW